MAVSLRKSDYKVDLSKPPVVDECPLPVDHCSLINNSSVVISKQNLAVTREITPEHILEEHTPFKEISITPVHTAKEEIPREEYSTESKPQITSCGDDAFLQHKEIQVHFPRWAIVLLSVLAVIAAAVLVILGIQALVSLVESLPVPEAPASTEPAADPVEYAINSTFDVTMQAFAYLTSNPLVSLLLFSGIAFSLFNMIKRLFKDIDR